jgi:hypothetical protein
VAALSTARNAFARSNTGIVGLNLTRGMDLSRFFSVCVVLRRERLCNRADAPPKEINSEGTRPEGLIRKV